MSQTISLLIVCSPICSGADQRNHQSSVSLAIIRGIHWWQVDSPHKGPVMRKMFPFDDIIMPVLDFPLWIYNYAETHYTDVILGMIVSQITSLTIVCSIVYSDTDQRKHQSSASLAFVWGIHRGPVNSPHKWPVMRKMFPFDDIIMLNALHYVL